MAANCRWGYTSRWIDRRLFPTTSFSPCTFHGGPCSARMFDRPVVDSLNPHGSSKFLRIKSIAIRCKNFVSIFIKFVDHLYSIQPEILHPKRWAQSHRLVPLLVSLNRPAIGKWNHSWRHRHPLCTNGRNSIERYCSLTSAAHSPNDRKREVRLV